MEYDRFDKMLHICKDLLHFINAAYVCATFSKVLNEKNQVLTELDYAVLHLKQLVETLKNHQAIENARWEEEHPPASRN